MISTPQRKHLAVFEEHSRSMFQDMTLPLDARPRSDGPVLSHHPDLLIAAALHTSALTASTCKLAKLEEEYSLSCSLQGCWLVEGLREGDYASVA